MSTPAKILVVLLFLLSMAFVVISLKSYAEIDAQAALIATLLQSSGEQKATVDSMNTTIGSAKGKIGDLKGEIENLKGDIASLTQAKEAVEAELAETQAAKKEVEGKLAEAVAQIEPLKAANAKYKTQVADLTDSNAKMKASLGKSVNELNQLKSVIAAHPAEWQRIINPQPDDPELHPSSGKVHAVKDYGVNAVVFNGMSQVRKGDSFSVFRDKTKVGKYVVGDIYRTVVITRETGGKIEGSLQEGDLLSP